MTVVPKQVDVDSLWYEFFELPGLFPKTNAAEDKQTEDFIVVSRKLGRTISDLETISRRPGDEFLVVHYEELELYYLIPGEKPCSG